MLQIPKIMLMLLHYAANYAFCQKLSIMLGPLCRQPIARLKMSEMSEMSEKINSFGLTGLKSGQ